MSMIKRRDLLALAVTALSPLAPRCVLAQSRYPERPVRLVIPFPPGGVFDAVGRPWAEKMKALLGTVVIENQGGAGGALGAAAVARAEPDGYTILLGGPATNVINATAVSRPRYDPKDLEPVSLLGSNAYSIAVTPAFPARTLKELVDLARSQPGKLSYGSSGVGSLNHLTGEVFKSLAGNLDIAHVPYRGAGPAMTDLISGQIPMAVASVTGQVIELHRSGKLRVLAVTSANRLAAAPELPTTAEAGLPGVDTEQFIGLFAPTGTSKAIIAQIAEATRAAMADRDYQQRLIASGFDPYPDSSPEKMRQVVEAEFAHWTPVIKAIGLKLD